MPADISLPPGAGLFALLPSSNKYEGRGVFKVVRCGELVHKYPDLLFLSGLRLPFRFWIASRNLMSDLLARAMQLPEALSALL